MSDVLDVIAQEVRSCTKCRLHEGTKHGVPGEGRPDAEILFVGEGPGFYEDAQGRPFVGAAGKLLSEMLQGIGMTRDDVFITNIVKHRPPGNRDPLPDEREACGEYLERQIREIDPVLIVTLGRHSMATFFGPTVKISQVHGTAKPWRDILAYACFHPAAALHQPRYMDALREDFAGLPKALEQARQRAAERRASPGDTGATDGSSGPDGEAPGQLSLF